LNLRNLRNLRMLFAAMLRFPEARQMVLEKVRQAAGLPGIEHTPLRQAAGRVLAEAVLADRDYPPFDRATRDGYAVRASDLAMDLAAIP